MIIYTIPTCKMCKELIERLDKNKNMSVINVDINPEIGDKIEKLYKTSIYPIIECFKGGNKYVFLRQKNLENEERIFTFITTDELMYKINKI